MRRQLPQKILFLNRDKGIRENRIPFSEFYSSISSAMTVRIAITTGIHFPRLIFFLPIWLWSETNGTGGQFRSPIRHVFRDTAASSSKVQGGTVAGRERNSCRLGKDDGVWVHPAANAGREPPAQERARSSGHQPQTRHQQHAFARFAHPPWGGRLPDYLPP